MKTNPGEINDLPNEPTYQGDRQKHTKENENYTQSKQLNAREDCAFDGAMMALVPITDVAHVIHGPSGCINNFCQNLNSLSSGSLLYRVRFTTDMEESDIIFGGAKKLYKAIVELKRRYKPSAVFVYSTCVSALIGDDINGVCSDVTEQIGIPVIPVDSPGFVGGSNQGIRLAGETLLDRVIGTEEPEFTTPYDINLIGEYNIAGAIWKILPLFEKLGIRVLAKITGDARYKEICYAHRAKLNVVSSSSPLLKMAKKMEQRYGIPHIESCFYTIEDVSRCLQNIAAQFNDPKLLERTEKLIAEETAVINEKLTPYRACLQGKRIVIYTEGVKSWSVISAARNLGMEAIAISPCKTSRSEKAKIKELLGKDSIILESENPKDIIQIINEHKANLLIAGDRYQDIALEAAIPFLNINQEHYFSYASYTGVLEVALQLYTTLNSPIWKQVRKSAPWDVEKKGE
ncbi:nitrogenase iron-molybdenum cofactor biosynthesis protein NifE [Scytonema sp. NUACC26]|uniref:nitrogenase iron-molybdenum cofactor biosynthesis protein NifE n=1 Tax=Scytonema sp. NUACC26 TaxID=3140176 RepID=UPI0034DBFB29